MPVARAIRPISASSALVSRPTSPAVRSPMVKPRSLRITAPVSHKASSAALTGVRETPSRAASSIWLIAWRPMSLSRLSVSRMARASRCCSGVCRRGPEAGSVTDFAC